MKKILRARSTRPNLVAALAILQGTAVVAHDRRKADAPAIDFVRTRNYKGDVALRPLYGISTRMQNTLTKLASRVELVKTKRGRTMPQYVFSR